MEEQHRRPKLQTMTNILEGKKPCIGEYNLVFVSKEPKLVGKFEYIAHQNYLNFLLSLIFDEFSSTASDLEDTRVRRAPFQ